VYEHQRNYKPYTGGIILQTIIKGTNSTKKIIEILELCHTKKFLLVCDDAFNFISAKDFFETSNLNFIKFSDFTPNPLYEQVAMGVEVFKKENCDTIVAVGGGSTIDVAKCIKLFCKMQNNECYLQNEFFDSKVPLVAIPTTAGTGSESTRYAVIYLNGAKQSVTHESIVPDYAILDPALLKTLPIYQKKCTLLDALCQGIESWWSINSTEESRAYSKKAVELIINNYKGYIFENDNHSTEKIMEGSNLSGKAINITQTTAPHAMSYKMTSLFNLPHGHAVAIGLPIVWDYMIKNIDKCIDVRGKDFIKEIFYDISYALGQSSPKEAISFFKTILEQLEISLPYISNEDLKTLCSSVNPTRLKNNPISLNDEAILDLYQKIGGQKSDT
jgi:alcohol dehydrogenase class IV